MPEFCRFSLSVSATFDNIAFFFVISSSAFDNIALAFQEIMGILRTFASDFYNKSQLRKHPKWKSPCKSTGRRLKLKQTPVFEGKSSTVCDKANIWVRRGRFSSPYALNSFIFFIHKWLKNFFFFWGGGGKESPNFDQKIKRPTRKDPVTTKEKDPSEK